jgi:hypothetical protein
MGFASGVTVCGAGSATLIMNPRAASAVTVQCTGGSVTVGGPGVTAGAGIVMGVNSLPVAIQATHFGNIEDVDDGLYAIPFSGSGTVSWVHGF